MLKANRNKTQEEHNNTCRDLDSLIKAIRTGSTARGTTPATRQIQPLDVWGRGIKWEDKVKDKSKNVKYPGLFDDKYKQSYGGAGNIEKGLLYIQAYMKKKVDRGMDTDAIYTLVVDQLEGIIEDNPPARQAPAHHPDLACEITNKTEKKQASKSVWLMALRTILNGYLSICTNSSLTNKTDQIVEWLLLIDLHSLITRFINPAQDTEEEQIRIYRSCVDLLSTGIVLRLKNNPNVLSKSSLGDDSEASDPGLSDAAMDIPPSKIIVTTSGQDALGQGLSVLGHRIDTNEKKNLPGFKLKTVLSTNHETHEKDIAVYFLVGNIRGRVKPLEADDRVACVGRISETIFDISQEDLNQLTAEVTVWCKDASADLKKTLCVDLTITKPRDELVVWMQSGNIQRLIKEKKLNILVWQSEQKVHSLGTGKFSAGSSYLLTADSTQSDAFNAAADEAARRAPDHNLSTFFRDYCQEAKHAIINQQKKSARIVAEWLNQWNGLGGAAIANGPFVNIVFYDKNREVNDALQKLGNDEANHLIEKVKNSETNKTLKNISMALSAVKKMVGNPSDKVKFRQALMSFPKPIDKMRTEAPAVKEPDNQSSGDLLLLNAYLEKTLLSDVSDWIRSLDLTRFKQNELSELGHLKAAIHALQSCNVAAMNGLYAKKTVFNAYDTLNVRFDVRQHALRSLQKIWPDSPSFGFGQTTTSARDEESIRISVGLESLESLQASILKLGYRRLKLRHEVGEQTVATGSHLCVANS